MRLAQHLGQSKGFRLECECGHRRQFDLQATLSVWGDADLTEVKARARCTACGKRQLSVVFTETADGAPLRLADLSKNVFHRCGDHNCLTAWWASPDEARAIAAGGTLDDYKAAITCPQCGRTGRYHHVRLTDDEIPTVTRWLGMSANEREAKRRR